MAAATYSAKKLKFFFEIFRLGNFTLRTFLVHMEVNRTAFNSWGQNSTQTLLEGLQDGLPHKKEGRGPILQAFQQSLCALKSTQNGYKSICLLQNWKSTESESAGSKIFFRLAHSRACPPLLVGELGQGKDGGRRERKGERHTKKWLERRKISIQRKFNHLGSSKPAKKEKEWEGGRGWFSEGKWLQPCIIIKKIEFFFRNF